MSLIDRFIQLFKKKEVVYSVKLKYCSCKQGVLPSLYKTKLKLHIIGSVVKGGNNFVLYCDGKERK